MTLTLTLKVFCISNVQYLYLKGTVLVLIKTKHSDNMTTNCGKINLNMRKMTHIEPMSCLCDLDLDLQ